MSNSNSQPSLLPITPSDVVGCRHRALLSRAEVSGLVQRDGLGNMKALGKRYDNKLAAQRRRDQLLAMLPTKPRHGDRIRRLTRVDITAADHQQGIALERTLEAMAEGTRLITNAYLAEGPLATQVDLLVREDAHPGVHEDMTYIPVCFSGHEVAREVTEEQEPDCRVLHISAVGLGTPQPVAWRHRPTQGSTQAVAMAHVILSQWGFASTEVGMASTARVSGFRCFFFSGAALLPGLHAALEEPVKTAPHRLKQCEFCEFHNHCRIQLQERQDVTLLLSGANANRFLKRGVDTIPELARIRCGEPSHRAEGWLSGYPALRRSPSKWVKNMALWGGKWFHPGLLGKKFNGNLKWSMEIDVDMEAHPDRGTFMWGAYDGKEYVSFSDFGPGGPNNRGDEGHHVARFWAWLMERRAEAEEQRKHFQVWVYSAQGEHFWMRFYARTYGGRDYGDVVMPSREEVDGFLYSGHWCDVYVSVNRALVGTRSLGLKEVAPLAGFNYSQKGVDGRMAITLYEQAMSGIPGLAEKARRTLELYNADDCYASRAVRQWLRRGAPGIPLMPGGREMPGFFNATVQIESERNLNG